MSNNTNVTIVNTVCSKCYIDKPATYELETENRGVLHLCNYHYETYPSAEIVTYKHIGPNNNQSLIDGLEKFIAFLKENPEFHEISEEKFYAFISGNCDHKYVVRQIKMLGSYNKIYNEQSFNGVKKFSDNISLCVYLSRDAICQQEVVGKKIVRKTIMQEPTPEQQAVIDAANALKESLYIEEDVEVDDVQWKCDEVIM